eukprot:1129740-Amphidinium_carterae.1
MDVSGFSKASMRRTRPKTARTTRQRERHASKDGQGVLQLWQERPPCQRLLEQTTIEVEESSRTGKAAKAQAAQAKGKGKARPRTQEPWTKSTGQNPWELAP